MELEKLHLHWRVSQYQGKTYRSYSLARARRQDGKNRKEIVLKLGWFYRILWFNKRLRTR